MTPILIAGPTASGKSAFALALAEATGATVVNADALQVYECWQVLTARPTASDLARARHALYGHVPYQTAYSVGAWLRAVADLPAGPKIIVGGTGLYLTALTKGLAEIPAIPPDIREAGDALRAAEGAAAFRRYLTDADPDLLTQIDPNNTARLQRGWEVHRATGRALSAWQATTAPPLVDPATARLFVLNADPDWLRARIARRFEAMIDDGALDEVAALAPRWDPKRPASRALGAPELRAVLQGTLPLDAAIEAAKTATNQFAKRQRTWFRNRMRAWTALDSAALRTDGDRRAMLLNR
ncbi:MAG: tRNA (adenosine(37)-N6)-dimethylallyltransferase MiaA [Pseudomonadota bacterium]